MLCKGVTKITVYKGVLFNLIYILNFKREIGYLDLISHNNITHHIIIHSSSVNILS